MGNVLIQQQFSEALDGLVGQIQRDRTILAAVLCGSLAHDAVWEKSDIDLVLVTADDRKEDRESVALHADGVNVHAWLLPRAQFRKTVEGALRNSFIHSLLAKGRLLYSHDPTVADLCAGLGALGARDARLQLLQSATHALPAIDKAHKWLITRGDLNYSALWILYAATPLAKVEVVSAGLLADREVIPQALKLNPAFFKKIYTDLLNAKKTRKSVQAALDAVDDYVDKRATTLFEPILEHLREVRETRSATEIEDYFKRNFDVSGVTTACEYLAHRGLLGKASAPVRLTRKSTIQVQELAFFHPGEPEDVY